MRPIDGDALKKAFYLKMKELLKSTVMPQISNESLSLLCGSSLITEAPTIEPEPKWIPCSERLPEYDKPVLLSTAWGKTEIGFWTQRGWMIVACSYREFEQDAVVAWMPLPEPFEPQEE